MLGGSMLAITPGDIATGADGGSPGAAAEAARVSGEGGAFDTFDACDASPVSLDETTESESFVAGRVSASVLSVLCAEVEAGASPPSPQPANVLAHTIAAYSEICIFIVIPCFVLCAHDGELPSQFCEIVCVVSICSDGVLKMIDQGISSGIRCFIETGPHLVSNRQHDGADIFETEIWCR
jgi:hypothetical protein